jgi:uncharacterized protein (DUF302 family)
MWGDTIKEFVMTPFCQLSSTRRLQKAVLAFVVTGAMLGTTPISANTIASQASVNEPIAAVQADGVVRIRSNHDVQETVSRIKAAVAAKGVRFFDAIDQAQLGKEVGLTVRPSTLILFGNPPLGVQFLQSNPYSGLDWPVRMLVVEDADGSVWLAWTDFQYIARRYHIKNRGPQFKMASEVAASIASEAAQ